MPSNQFSKQPQQLSSAFGGKLNGGNGDAVIGGLMTGVPAGLNANQFIQDVPGDRLVLGMADALALSKTSIGTLYGGVYQYVTITSTITLAVVRGKAAFWDTAAADDSYSVISDESGTLGVNFWAGVFINVITAGYSGYIQIAGKAKCLFTSPISGTGAAGSAVFVAADGVGRFDMYDGNGNAPTIEGVSLMLMRFAGVGGAATANTVSTVDIPMRQVRW